MDFVALDVETANRERGSICQVGVAVYAGGALAHQWASYVDPRAPFDPFNTALHGISARTVAGAPTMAGIDAQLHALLDGRVVVSHSSFDRGALQQAAARHGLRPPDCTWLDSVQVARRAWPHLKASGGYSLGRLCAALGYRFDHHDALADATAAGYIVCVALRELGLAGPGWREALLAPAARVPAPEPGPPALSSSAARTGSGSGSGRTRRARPAAPGPGPR